jgi:hypothetical protein
MNAGKVIFLFLFIISFDVAKTQSVRINEFMALNQTSLTDEDNDYSDWIEIYNPTNQAISLEGWTLSDDKSEHQKWTFPNILIAAGEYLIIFASGKDRQDAGNILHTNFKLNGSGEYLALFNKSGTTITKFDPFYPEQQTDYSYGYFNNSYIVFSDPTPGEDNQDSTAKLLPFPVFNKKHGFYDSSFYLTITSDIGNTNIYYTTDGSEPSVTNGSLYSSPVYIQTTSIIRAINTLSGEQPSKINTQTYLFLDDVMNQPNDPSGYPDQWGPYTAISGTAIADYEMDPELVGDPAFANSLKEALKSIPTISLVSDKDNFFSKEQDSVKGGIYIYTGPPISNLTYGTGKGWERPVSLEYFDDDGNLSLQIDCSIQIQGGHSRRPERSPKHSFRLVFKSKYGPTKLRYPLFKEERATDKFNTIVLKTSFGDAWHHDGADRRERAQYIRDSWARDTQIEMGWPSAHSNFVHLYLNGIYWGLYNLTERLDKEFMKSYLGGREEDYNVIKDYTEVLNGNIIAWNKMLGIANQGLTDNASYQRIQGKNANGTPNPNYESLLNVENLIDYMIINFYGGNTDWDHHNWAAAINRTEPDNGFYFFCWDSEFILINTDINVTDENNDNCPSRIFQQLSKNEDFCRLFADRVQKYCFNGGLLTPQSASNRWIIRRNQIEKAVISESARWGDYRRDVHQFKTAGPFDLYTKENHWLPKQDFLLNTYFPDRTDIFISQLRTTGLFPDVEAPLLLINDIPITQNIVSSGDNLTMSAPKGTIYYTTDGTDPVVWSPPQGITSPSAELYSSSISVNESSHIKARSFFNGDWSALTDKFFIIPADFHDLKITEIHYHPLNQDTIGDGNFEFVEIKNTGTSTLDLGGLQFVKGIEFEFPHETEIGPQEFIVLASDYNYFYDLYGFSAFDDYRGKLDNNGEKIILVTNTNDTICSVRYYDTNEWPHLPDGYGHSLVPIDINPTGDQNLASSWRSSYSVGGSPGADDLPDNPMAIEEITAIESLKLYQNYPNPFRNVTYINYQLQNDAQVKLSVYNLVGQNIKTLVSKKQLAGLYQVEWNGTNHSNSRLASGIYYYKIEIRDQYQSKVLAKKMILMR